MPWLNGWCLSVVLQYQVSCKITSSCKHWHDQVWMLWTACNSILSYAKNNQVKLKPLRLADTSKHTCVLSDSGIESITVCISCGSNVVLRSIASNDDKWNNTTPQTLPQKVSSNPSQASLGWVGLINWFDLANNQSYLTYKYLLIT